MRTQTLVAAAAVVFAAAVVRRLRERAADSSAASEFDVNFPHRKIVAVSLSVFSESYSEARDKFRSAASAAGGKLHALVVIPGETYTIDIAVWQGTGEGLVVHSSGVHGVEGFAGSAIQIGAIGTLVGEGQDHSPTIVLVHAVNPYGMAHFRRFNEHNVSAHPWPLPRTDLSCAV